MSKVTAGLVLLTAHQILSPFLWGQLNPLLPKSQHQRTVHVSLGISQNTVHCSGNYQILHSLALTDNPIHMKSVWNVEPKNQSPMVGAILNSMTNKNVHNLLLSCKLSDQSLAAVCIQWSKPALSGSSPCCDLHSSTETSRNWIRSSTVIGRSSRKLSFLRESTVYARYIGTSYRIIIVISINIVIIQWRR